MFDTNRMLADPDCALCDGHGSQAWETDEGSTVRVCSCVIEERRRRIEEAKARSRAERESAR